MLHGTILYIYNNRKARTEDNKISLGMQEYMPIQDLILRILNGNVVGKMEMHLQDRPLANFHVGNVKTEKSIGNY